MSLLMSGCSERGVCPNTDKQDEILEGVGNLRATTKSMHLKLQLDSDFNQAADTYLSGIDISLRALLNRIDTLENRLAEINSILSFKRIVSDIIRESK
jgi:hypothetical protein